MDKKKKIECSKRGQVQCDIPAEKGTLATQNQKSVASSHAFLVFRQANS
jgi:hypothetical protein